MQRAFPILTKAQIEGIHEKSLYFLEKYGIQFHNEEAKEIFRRAGARIDGDTVRIPSGLVSRALESAPKEFLIESRDDAKSSMLGEQHKSLLTPCGMPPNVIESEHHRRAATAQDLERFLKLAHTSRQCDIMYPGIVFPHMAGRSEDWVMLYQTYRALSLSDKPFLGHSKDLFSARATVEMASAATGKTCGYYAIGNVSSVSPLQWHRDMTDALMYFAKANQPIMVMSCPMAGMTSHMFPENTLLISNVEILAGIVLNQLVRPGAPVIYSPHAYVADLRHMNITIGSAESTRLYMASSQLARFYNLPCMVGGALSDAKDFDVQMGIESTSNIYMNLMCNVDLGFQFFGVLDNYNSISYEKWIADEEIIDRYRILEQPMDDVTFAYADIIGELGSDALYAADDDTAECYRDFMQEMPVSTHMNYENWEKGRISCRQRALEVCEKRIAQYDALGFEPNPEVEAVYRKYLEICK